MLIHAAKQLRVGNVGLSSDGERALPGLNVEFRGTFGPPIDGRGRMTSLTWRSFYRCLRRLSVFHDFDKLILAPRALKSAPDERYETDRRVPLVHRPFERILRARVECLNVLVVESLFVNLDACAKQ